MKIIDEKGKLFGKINIIDFLVVLLLLCVLPAFYLVHDILTKKPVVAPRRFIEVEIECQVIKLKPELVKIVSVGDKELDENGEEIGEIITLSESKPYEYNFDIGQGQRMLKEATDLRQLDAKLRLRASIKESGLYYKDRAIDLGSPLEFKTKNYTLTAIPTLKREGKRQERIMDLYVTLKDLDESTIEKISVGDKEVGENGEVIAEILSLGKIETSSLKFNLGGGSFVEGEDSGKKQISAKMRLRCQVGDNNQLYFKSKKVEYNTPLEFKTNKYKAIGLIAKTFEIFEMSPSAKKKWISLQVKFSGVIPEIANIVQKGDVERSASEGKVEARIKSIISNKPSEILTLERSKFITLSHPFQKDIAVSLDVLCIEKEGIYYFKNYPVKMGNNIVLATDLYSISGIIVGLEIK